MNVASLELIHLDVSYYTWVEPPPRVEEQVIGKAAAELLWRDDLDAGVQMALFDAVGKAGARREAVLVR